MQMKMSSRIAKKNEQKIQLDKLHALSNYASEVCYTFFYWITMATCSRSIDILGRQLLNYCSIRTLKDNFSALKLFFVIILIVALIVHDTHLVFCKDNNTLTGLF